MAKSGARSCTVLICLVVFVSTAAMSQARPARQLQNDVQQGQKVLRVDLLHRDHPNSPLSSNGTLTERVAAAVQRSKDRRAHVSTRRGLLATDFQTPVEKSSTVGEYVMSISQGTPAQQFVAIVDTGSDLVWLQCDCLSTTTCVVQTDPFFNPNASSTYVPAPCTDPLCAASNLNDVSCGGSCQYLYGYGDGSTTAGTFATETITLTDSSGTATPLANFYFGCGDNQTGQYNGADGLIGFGQGAVSFPSQLGSLYAETFAYCLVAPNATATSSSPLLFGSSASGNGLTLSYTPILSNPANPTYYYVPMVGITVNGVDLGIPATTFELSATGDGGVVLDSGTTYTNLDQASITSVVQALQPLITYTVVDGTSYGFPLCYNITQVASPVYPAVSFQFTGTTAGTVVDFPLANENLFVTADTGVQCLGFQASSDSPFIIGNVVQADHYMEHDLVNKQVGWVQQTCS